MRTYFHCYATANDMPSFATDLKNLKRLKEQDPGVDAVQLFVAISEVNPVGEHDHNFIDRVKQLFANHPFIKLCSIFHKSNVGRDFSSFNHMLDKVTPLAASDDYVFFQNRSGHGPYLKNWYQGFINQFERFDKVAICGSTINFYDLHLRSDSNDLPHVQTYAFLSSMHYLNQLESGFPGSEETEKENIITKGEIALSQQFMDLKFKLTCMEWPHLVIDKQSKPPTSRDVKSIVKQKHAFYHRNYFKPSKILKRFLGIGQYKIN
ncbi:hypothetical protein [Winogradskyella aurantiaca]|uniref:hypothetical protein n=1 Tax=Winogradskyella aurantiaca TaxID=2219558 RepID=UPI000E1DA2D2|nr:hypothetical protein [Winogradskyella aurantiaca]